jgi:tetratricopeptide (TPR) repeat protein
LKQFDLSIKDFSKAIEINPGFGDAFYYLGLTFDELGQRDTAIINYTRSVGKPEIGNHRVDAFHKRADAYFELGKYELTIEDTTEILKIEPTDGKAYRKRGMARQKLGDEEGAQADFLKAKEAENTG